MGLHVCVFKNPLGDCTNGGISSGAKQLCLINVEGPFEPKPETPAALLVQNGPGMVRIVPADENGQQVKQWVMFGGNYAASSDSRLSEAVEQITEARFYGAIAIHDRIEN